MTTERFIRAFHQFMADLYMEYRQLQETLDLLLLREATQVRNYQVQLLISEQMQQLLFEFRMLNGRLDYLQVEAQASIAGFSSTTQNGRRTYEDNIRIQRKALTFRVMPDAPTSNADNVNDNNNSRNST